VTIYQYFNNSLCVTQGILILGKIVPNTIIKGEYTWYEAYIPLVVYVAVTALEALKVVVLKRIYE
jgi:hypothetical protein